MSVDIGLAIAGDPELADILRRADTSDDPLTPVEWVRFNALLYSAVAGFQAGFYNYRRGFADAEAWQGHERDVVALLGSAAARAWWARERGRFSPGLVEHLDDLLDVAPLGIPTAPPHSDLEGQ